MKFVKSKYMDPKCKNDWEQNRLLVLISRLTNWHSTVPITVFPNIDIWLVYVTIQSVRNILHCI
jgi:hypothetical protein